MSGIKCPFCQHKLQYDDLLCSCVNEHCEESFDMVGTELLWQKVIDLKQEIDGTRKALEIAIQYIKHTQSVEPFWFNSLANKTLNKIKTTLKQKDVK